MSKLKIITSHGGKVEEYGNEAGPLIYFQLLYKFRGSIGPAIRDRSHAVFNLLCKVTL